MHQSAKPHCLYDELRLFTSKVIVGRCNSVGWVVLFFLPVKVQLASWLVLGVRHLFLTLLSPLVKLILS